MPLIKPIDPAKQNYQATRLLAEVKQLHEKNSKPLNHFDGL